MSSNANSEIWSIACITVRCRYACLGQCPGVVHSVIFSYISLYMFSLYCCIPCDTYTCSCCTGVLCNSSHYTGQGKSNLVVLQKLCADYKVDLSEVYTPVLQSNHWVRTCWFWIDVKNQVKLHVPSYYQWDL